MRTILTGSLAYDRIMEFPEAFSDYLLADKLHNINVCFMVNGMQENFGGTAGNIAYALNLLGGKPEISATLGLDNQRYITWLKENSISIEHIRIVEDDWTAGAYITTDKNDNQVTCFNPGAMRSSSELDFSDLDNNDLIVISPGNLEDMINYPKQCRKHGISYIFDPGQAMPVLQGQDLLDCINGCKLLMVNDYEMNLIISKTELTQEEILERAGSTIITFGEKGSTLYTGLQQTPIPVSKADKIADPTGAGDAYRGGLLRGLVQGKSLEESCTLGSVSASFAVECYGTQVHSFTSDEFEKRHKLIS